MGTVGGFLVLFYNGVLGMSATWVGAALLVPRLWDAVIDPSVGKWSDSSKSRFGRRRPFILGGGLLMCLVYALLFNPPAWFASDLAKTVYVIVGGILFFSGYSFYSIPYGALAIEMTPDYKERTSIMAIRNFVAGGGQMLIGTMPWFVLALAALLGREGNERLGYGVTGWLFAAISALLIIACVFTTKERSATETASQMPLFKSMAVTLRNRLFVRLSLAICMVALSIMTLGSYMNYLFIYYLNNKDLLAVYGIYSGILGIPMGFLWWYIANRIGKTKGLLLAQGILCVGSFATLFCFNKTFPYLVFVVATLYGIGWSGVLVLVSAVLADITDIDELETGQRREGSYTGVYCFMFKLAIAISAPVLGVGVDWSGFTPELGVNQTPQTFLILRLITGLVSTFFALVAFFMLWRFPLTPERALEVRRILEERRGKATVVQ
jgi:GPH family glycoside/pentoside/hexuronide:cation symporter